MIARTLRGLIQLLGGLGAGFAIVLAWGAWQLSSGPLSLGFVNDHLQEALSDLQPGIRVSLGDTILTWAGWERTLDVRVIDMRLSTAEGTPIARVPEVSLSLSARALLKGVLVPKSVELFRPRVEVVRRADGTLQVAVESAGGESASSSSRQVSDQVIRDLLAEPDPQRPLTYLSRIAVEDGDLSLVDERLGLSWRVPAVDLILKRGVVGVRGEARFELDIAERVARVVAEGTLNRDTDLITFATRFENLVPAGLAGVFPGLQELEKIDLPLDGTISAVATRKGDPLKVDFGITGAAGRVQIPDPAAQALEVAGLSLNGTWDAASEILDIAELSLDLGPGGGVMIPGPVEHRMPVGLLALKARYLGKEDRLELPAIDADLQGPRVHFEAGVENVTGDFVLAGSGTLRDTPVNRLREWWAPGWGVDARRWVMTHLSQGRVPEVRAKVALRRGEDGEIALDDLSGDMDIEGVTVDYLPPMPKAVGANGRAEFGVNSFDIYVSGGKAGGLDVRKGSVLLSGLAEVDQYADIDLTIDGPVRKAMELIDSKPLGFATALGITPERTAGDASTRVRLRFMLAKDLTLDDVEVAAGARVKNALVTDVLFGRDVTSEALEILVNKTGMDVKGEATLFDVPTQFTWRENFTDDAKFRSRYNVVGRIENVKKALDLGIDLRPFSDDFLGGAAGAELSFTRFDERRAQLYARLDLADLQVTLPALKWDKRAGVPGTGEVDVFFTDGLISDLPLFKLKAGDLEVAGSARYDPNGTGLARIDVDRLAYGRTDVKGVVVPRDDGVWEANLTGPSLDLSPLFEDLSEAATGGVEPAEGEENFQDTLRYSLSVNLDRLWVGEDRGLTHVAGTLVHEDSKFTAVLLNALLDDEKSLEVSLRPGGKGRLLDVTTDDAGAMLRTFDLYENMKGGELKLSGEFHDILEERPLAGTLRIENYRIANAPTLAHVVGVMALTGILDTLQGDGIGFTTLEVPFMRKAGVIEIKEARAAGASLGFTAKGKIYPDADFMEIEGTLVPAYAVNAALGNIPILGALFSGGEKGSGIFAAKYKISGPMEQPALEVNPLSALAPSFLRNLFDILEPPAEAPGPDPNESTNPPDGSD